MSLHVIFLLILVDMSLIFFYSLTLFHLWYASMWLHDALVSSYVPSHYLAVGPHDAFPVKDPHFTIPHHRVSSSSVIRASGQVMQGHGLKSHLELGFFFRFDLISTFYACGPYNTYFGACNNMNKVAYYCVISKLVSFIKIFGSKRIMERTNKKNCTPLL